MQIWVDADACPAVVKEILFRAAERVRVRVTSAGPVARAGEPSGDLTRHAHRASGDSAQRAGFAVASSRSFTSACRVRFTGVGTPSAAPRCAT